MSWNQAFFCSFWPLVGPAVTTYLTGTGREVSSLLRLLRLRPGACILDVPCGFGRHSVELARRGFRVTGVDISPELLAQARRAAAAKGVAVEFCRSDMRRLAYRQRFDAVLNLFTSFGYFGDDGDLRVLRRFRRALRPGGRLLLHLVNRDWLLRNFQPRHRARMGEYLVAQKRTFDFETSVLIAEWTARRGRRVWQTTSHLRLYSCHELVRMLKQVRFSGVKFFGDLRGGPLSFDSRWLVLLARR